MNVLRAADPVSNQRPELVAQIASGDVKIRRLLGKSAKTFKPHDVLIEAGEEHEFVYRLREGWAGRTRVLDDGRTQHILIFLPGDLFAVKSMFVRRHPDAIETLSQAVLERIDRQELFTAYKDDPDIAMRCTWQVVEEERRLHNWVVSLGRGDVGERIAALLLQFRSRLAVAGVIERNAATFLVPMTQQELADHLGLSLVHLNKSLKKLREAGLISIAGREFTIENWRRLSMLALPLLDPSEASSPDFVGPVAEPTARTA